MYSCFNARACGLALSATETIDLAAAAGFDGVDLMVRDLLQAGDRPEMLLERMTDLGLRGGSFPLPMNWRGDEATFRLDLVELPRYAEAAMKMELQGTGTWVMPESPLDLDGPDGFAKTVAFHLDRIGAIAEVLTRFGITLALEVIGVKGSRLGQTPRFMTQLTDLTPIAMPLADQRRLNIGLLLDTWHLYAAGERLNDILAITTAPISWIHVADLPAGDPRDQSQMLDAIRGLPGDNGAVDNRMILQTLKDVGYKGPVTVEPMARCSSLQGLDPNATARAIAASLRGVWPT